MGLGCPGVTFLQHVYHHLLQCILNCLGRVVTKLPSFTHIVLLLCSLHWLLLKYRVHFKICLRTYKTLHEEQPVYLRSLIATSLPSRSLRSNRGITLSIPRIKTNTDAKVLQLMCPFSLEQPSTICPFSHLSCHLQKTSQNIPFRLSLPPVDTGVPNGLLMYGIASMTSYLKTDLAVVPLSLATSGILVL